MNLEQVLVDRGLLEGDAVVRAAAEAAATHSPLQHVLVRDGLVTEEQVAWHLADANDLPFVHLTPEMADAEIARRSGEAFLRSRCALPLYAMAGEVTFVVGDPELAGGLGDFRTAAGGDLEVSLAVAQESKIRLQLDRLFGPEREDRPHERILVDPSGVATFYGHLARAARDRVEELRFEPTPSGVVVRVRRGRETRTIDRLPPQSAHAVAARARILLAGASEGRVRTVLHGTRVDLAIDVVPSRHADAVVVALESHSAANRPTIEALLGGPAVDYAARRLLEGPVLLVAAARPRMRRDLALGLLAAAGQEAVPMVVCDELGSPGGAEEEDLPAIFLRGPELALAKRLAPRTLLVDLEQADPELVRELAAAVPSVVVTRPEASAASALALCPEPLRPLVRAAVGPTGVMEAPRWI